MNKIESKIKIPHQWVHMGDGQLRREKFNDIVNLPRFNKPSGGLWASPYEKGGTYLSDWHEQAIDMGFEVEQDAVVFSLKDDARVCVIDNQLDLMRVVSVYAANDLMPVGWPLAANNQTIDFELLKKAYDVIYLTEKGQWDTRIPSINPAYNLYGWDCASCLVLNYDAIDKQQPITVS